MRAAPPRLRPRPAIALGAAALALSCASACASDDDDGDLEDAAPAPADAPPLDAAAWQAGPVSVVEEPGSSWRVALEGADVVARHVDAELALLVDPTSGAADGRYAGIYVVVAGAPRYRGRYNATDCSLFVPDRPFKDQEAVAVAARGPTLEVTMTEGSLSEMTDSAYPSDEPFRWQSRWTLEAGGLRLVAGGLYYLLPSRDACTVTLSAADGTELGRRDLTTDTAPFLEYFEDVRTIGVASSVGESLTIATDAPIVQLEVPRYPDTSLFELDFDHSFKERGQADIRAEVLLPL